MIKALHQRSPVIRWAMLFFFFLWILPNIALAAKIDPVRKVADNGMVVLVLERPSLPIVSVEVLVRAGAVYDPEEKAGLANLTAALLDEGTRRRSSKEIADAVDFIGARLSAGADADYASASLKVVKKDVETGFDLLADILIHPRFDPAEVERVKKNVLGRILSQKDEPGIIAQRAFNDRLFGKHPYHLPVIGLEETVPSITPAEIAAFHAGYYRPNQTIIAIVGQVTVDEAMGLVNKYFGVWEKKKAAPPKLIPAKAVARREVHLIDKELTQANIILGHLGIARENPDYYPVLVMNYILGGGGFSSRLLTEIRDNQGLVYSAYSRFDANRDPGSFAVVLQTKNENANAAINGVIEEIRRIIATPVSDQELADAKDYLIGSFPLRLDSTSKLAGLLPLIEFYHLGLDYFEKYPQYIAKVTRADVHRVAKKYLHPDRYLLVVVAKQSEAKVKEK